VDPRKLLNAFMLFYGLDVGLTFINFDIEGNPLLRMLGRDLSLMMKLIVGIVLIFVFKISYNRFGNKKVMAYVILVLLIEYIIAVSINISYIIYMLIY